VCVRIDNHSCVALALTLTLTLTLTQSTTVKLGDACYASPFTSKHNNISSSKCMCVIYTHTHRSLFHTHTTYTHSYSLHRSHTHIHTLTRAHTHKHSPKYYSSRSLHSRNDPSNVQNTRTELSHHCLLHVLALLAGSQVWGHVRVRVCL